MMQAYDAVIVGGGPAGASCAVWLARLGLRPVLIDAQADLGGLSAQNPFRDDWIAVLPEVTGVQVAQQIARSVHAAGVPVLSGWRALDVVTRHAAGHPPGFDVTVGDAHGALQTLSGRTLVVASGVRARSLAGVTPRRALPGVLVGPGIHIEQCDFAGQRVAILGGGDNGFENFAFVRARGASQVHLYARSVRAQRQFVKGVPTDDLHIGSYAVDPLARTVNGRPYDLILVFHGWEPQADFATGLALACDERGFIRTAFETAQTNLAGVYAIGEAAQRMHPCVVTSLADGVVAAKAIQAQLEKGEAMKDAIA